MKNLFQFFIVASVILVCILGFGAWNLPQVHATSGLNRVINFQGRVVKKADGTNVSDGTYSFTFKIYDAASSGNLLWQETQSSVQVTSGIFQVSLGSVTPFNGGGYNVNFNQSNLYLDITFNSETFGSRIQLAAVPQAINSEQLDSVIATTSATGFSLQGGQSSNSTVSFTTSGSTLTMQPTNADGLTLLSNGANTLTLDTGSAATITEGATATTLNIGTSNTATTVMLGSGTGGDTIQIGHGTVANGNTQTIAIGDSATGTGKDQITIGNTNGASSITLNVGTGGLALNLGSDATGDLYYRNSGGTLSRLAVGSGSQCLIGGTTPSWGSCGSGSSQFTTFTNNSNTIIAPSPLTQGLSIGNGGTGNYLPYTSLYIEPAVNSKGNALVAINQTGTGDIFTASASAAPKFRITSGGQVDLVGGLTADIDTLSSANGLKIGTVNASSLTLGTSSITTTAQGTMVIGTGGNTFTFNPASGSTYAGTARPAKQIVLSAEYAGAVLTASGSATIDGNMTSDASPSATPTSYDWENYYMWYATTAEALQDYTVAVRVTLPKDFAAWAGGNCLTVAYNTAFTSSTLNDLDVYLYQNADTSGIPIAFRTGNASGTSQNWTTVNFTSTDFSGTKSWNTAGSTAVIYLKMRSANVANYVQVGDITLNYVAAF